MAYAKQQLLEPRSAGYRRAMPCQQTGQEQLIYSHMALVRRIASHMRPMLPNNVAIDDIIQAGMVALTEASRAYEDRGHAFSTYANMRIRGAMVDLIRKNVNATRHVLVCRKTLQRTRAELEQLLHRAPAPREMAAALKLNEQQYATLAAKCEPVRLEPIDNSSSCALSWFASNDERADEKLDHEKIHKLLLAAIDSLHEREARILRLFFMDEKSLEEIGSAMGIGAARVCQIKKQALGRLRSHLAQYRP
ncbi:MAG: sigma-70 family RNA polymerase sigma factor [Sphingopyxis sp.]